MRFRLYTKAKIRLSRSNWVVDAKLKREGGFQYFGTNMGSVKPPSMLNALTQSICFLKKGFEE
jgi:hypothetical protein